MSDDNGIESLAVAKMFREWIADEVAKQVQRIAPRRRIAQVAEIHLDTRRADVVYVGESEPVSLPFNAAVPAYPGQYVVIDGPPQDRSIVDVLGESGVEQKVADNLSTNTPLPAYWEAASLGTLETFPVRIRNTDPRFGLSGGTVVVSPIRVRVDTMLTKVSVWISDSGSSSNRVTMGVYSIEPDLSLALLASTVTTPVSNGPWERDLDSAIDAKRGQLLALAVRVHGSNTHTQIMSLLHGAPPTPEDMPYSLATVDGTSSMPTSIADSQFTFRRNAETIWAAVR